MAHALAYLPLVLFHRCKASRWLWKPLGSTRGEALSGAWSSSHGPLGLPTAVQDALQRRGMLSSLLRPSCGLIPTAGSTVSVCCISLLNRVLLFSADAAAGGEHPPDRRGPAGPHPQHLRRHRRLWPGACSRQQNTKEQGHVVYQVSVVATPARCLRCSPAGGKAETCGLPGFCLPAQPTNTSFGMCRELSCC